MRWRGRCPWDAQWDGQHDGNRPAQRSAQSVATARAALQFGSALNAQHHDRRFGPDRSGPRDAQHSDRRSGSAAPNAGRRAWQARPSRSP